MRWPTSPDVSALWKREFHIDPRPMIRRARERPEAVILGLGVAMRVITYLWNRAMWLDEGSLRGNVVDVAILDFSVPLWNDQLAPMGFLILLRTIAVVLGGRNYVLRSVPLVAGIASLFLFDRLARRLLPRRSALVALALFAFSDDAIYYSSEFKPYTLDMAIALGITLLTVETIGRSPSARRAIWMGVLLGISPWFSFASAFVIAGCGLALVLDAIIGGRPRDAALWLLMGLGWLADFAVAHRASQAMLSPYTTMYRFWDFAFLPLRWPPDRVGVHKTAALILEVFVNPLNLLTPAGFRPWVVLPLVLLIVGAVAMARRSPLSFIALATPVAIAMAASVARLYPFHGRLLLELVPAFFLWIAAGTESLARILPDRSGIPYRMLLVALLAYPTFDACYQCTGRRFRDFNSHGDLHPNVFIDIPGRSAYGRAGVGTRPG